MVECMVKKPYWRDLVAYVARICFYKSPRSEWVYDAAGRVMDSLIAGVRRDDLPPVVDKDYAGGVVFMDRGLMYLTDQRWKDASNRFRYAAQRFRMARALAEELMMEGLGWWILEREYLGDHCDELEDMIRAWRAKDEMGVLRCAKSILPSEFPGAVKEDRIFKIAMGAFLSHELWSAFEKSYGNEVEKCMEG